MVSDYVYEKHARPQDYPGPALANFVLSEVQRRLLYVQKIESFLFSFWEHLQSSKLD